MIMDEKTIKETLLKGERVTLECKKAKAEVPKSIWQTYSALLGCLTSHYRSCLKGCLKRRIRGMVLLNRFQDIE